MKNNAIKLNPEVFIYTISDRIFLRSEENVYEVQEVNDIEKTLFFIMELTKGLNIDEFVKNLTERDRADFLNLYDFLNSKRFFTQEGNLINDNFFNFSKYFSDINALNENIEKLKNINVKIICGDEKLKRLLERGLQDNGFSDLFNSHNSKDTKLAVFVKDYKTNEKEVEDINLENFKNKTPWLLVDLSIGNYISIGPLIIPDKTACYKCFLERRMINDDTITAHSLSPKKIIKDGRVNYLPLHYNFATSIIVDSVLRFSLGLPALIQSCIIYIDLQKFETWKESLLKYPKCQVCGLTK